MPVFYFPIDGAYGDKIISFMDNLNENFGVKVTDALRVETDIEFLVPMLERLMDLEPEPAPDPIQESAVIAKKTIATMARAKTGPGTCLRCGQSFDHGVAGYCSKHCYNLAYKQRQKVQLEEIACANCGKMFLPSRKDTKTCSPECYKETKRKPRPESKPVILLPNQAKVNENLTEEQKRIDAVVAGAKDIAPSASFEHHHIDGPIMARKL